MRTWYGGAVRDVIENSNIVDRDYENEIIETDLSDTQLILRGRRQELQLITKVQINSVIKRSLNEFINLRTISNIYIFNRSGESIFKFWMMKLLILQFLTEKSIRFIR